MFGTSGGSMSPFCWDTKTFQFDAVDSRALAIKDRRRFTYSDGTEKRYDDDEEDEVDVTLAPPPPGHRRATVPEAAEVKDGQRYAGETSTETSATTKKKSKSRQATNPELQLRQFKFDVIRKLLKEFNLEKTISKYRSLTSKPYRINPAEFSFDWYVIFLLT